MALPFWIRADSAAISPTVVGWLAPREGHPPIKITPVCAGWLAATGKGHGTGDAMILGFLGKEPERVDVEGISGFLAESRDTKQLTLPWGAVLDFDEKKDIDFKRLKPLPLHPNATHLMALDSAKPRAEASR